MPVEHDFEEKVLLSLPREVRKHINVYEYDSSNSKIPEPTIGRTAVKNDKEPISESEQRRNIILQHNKKLRYSVHLNIESYRKCSTEKLSECIEKTISSWNQMVESQLVYERAKYIWFFFKWWLITALTLYALGSILAWVIRGFKRA